MGPMECILKIYYLGFQAALTILYGFSFHYLPDGCKRPSGEFQGPLRGGELLIEEPQVPQGLHEEESPAEPGRR